MPLLRRCHRNSVNAQLSQLQSSGRTAFERRRLVLTLIFGVFIATMVFSIESRWPRNSIVRDLLFILGILLALVGALGRTWCHLFISGYKTKDLIQVGPYSMCRNPLYLCSALGMSGVGLCSGTLTLPAIMCLFFAVYYPWIIRCEEHRLEVRHASRFLDYRKRTPRFWPRHRAYCEPETYTIYPRIIRKHIVYGGWFIFLAALVHVVSEQQKANVLPSLLTAW